MSFYRPLSLHGDVPTIRLSPQSMPGKRAPEAGAAMRESLESVGRGEEILVVREGVALGVPRLVQGLDVAEARDLVGELVAIRPDGRHEVVGRLAGPNLQLPVGRARDGVGDLVQPVIDA